MPKRGVVEVVFSEDKKFWEEVKAAGELLWGHPLAQAKWLLDFSRHDVRLLPLERQYQFAVALLVFAKFTTMPSRREGLTIDEEDLPTPEQVSRANILLQVVLGDLKREGETEMTARGWCGVLRFKGKQIVGHLSIDVLDLLDAFTIRLHETLADLANQKASLSQCAQCGRFFVTKRKDSSVCSSSCRTVQWRRAHPEEFKAQRHAAYVRMQRKKPGLANARIQTRASTWAARRGEVTPIARKRRERVAIKSRK